MSVSLIFARSKNHCIGASGRIPWHLPDEFGHFKRTTMGKPIIMGRKTYEDHQSALPGRLNVVITRQKNYKPVAGIEVAASLEAAIELASRQSDEVFVIGGVSFFVQAMPLAKRVYETVIDADIEGDAVLPVFDFSSWKTEQLEHHDVDERHQYPYTIYLHSRK